VKKETFIMKNIREKEPSEAKECYGSLLKKEI